MVLISEENNLDTIQEIWLANSFFADLIMTYSDIEIQVNQQTELKEKKGVISTENTPPVDLKYDNRIYFNMKHC